jgi:hypothetical protein|tara:strand:- start:1880 stop:2386 length:507 start_codon:yes stop_codon:yes gene_type:complete
MQNTDQIHFQSRLEIEYLQRRYARATDLLGHADKDSIDEGRRIYHRIFTPDVEMTVTGNRVDERQSSGIDGWLEVVTSALGPLGPTQHLIGTQLVEIETLAVDSDNAVSNGRALMRSYVQAWHDMPDGQVWLFIGTYTSDVRFTPGAGWQIWRMNLHRETGELRPMGA